MESSFRYVSFNLTNSEKHVKIAKKLEKALRNEVSIFSQRALGKAYPIWSYKMKKLGKVRFPVFEIAKSKRF